MVAATISAWALVTLARALRTKCTRQRCKERRPEHLVLAVAHIDAEDLAGVVGRHAGGDHGRAGHHPAVDAGTRREAVSQNTYGNPAWSSLRCRNTSTSASMSAQVRDTVDLENAAVAPERPHQVVDLAGRGAVHVGGHDHRAQGAVDPATRLQQRGEERADLHLRDAQLHIPSRSRQPALASTVALVAARLGALMRC